ncbi:hypothetical protein DFH09DRAFT_1431746 [Mycena vulgaris]|nr:hypothetical protein DFH09DRAFT_1431746 [Mycena vulgaris]
MALSQPSPTASNTLGRKECTGAAQLAYLFNQWLSWAQKQPVFDQPLNVNVQALHGTIDTGTDRRGYPPGGIGAFEDTDVVKEINYGGGASINGTIGLAQVSIAGDTIPRQAFVNVTQNVGLDECGSGNCGLIGLGFDSPTAGIQKALSTAGLNGPGLGKSVLFSIFDVNPTKGRFFALALLRLGDTKDTANASLSISEYERQYEGVQGGARQPLFPATSKSWHILSDGVSVNGVSIPWTANDAGTPFKQILVGLDSGRSPSRIA